MALKEVFDDLLSGYPEVNPDDARRKRFKKPLETDAPKIINEFDFITDDYLVEGSVGKGLTSHVPWIAVFYKKITTSAEKGVYIVYLLSKDGKRLYLTFNQGCRQMIEDFRKEKKYLLFEEY